MKHFPDIKLLCFGTILISIQFPSNSFTNVSLAAHKDLFISQSDTINVKEYCTQAYDLRFSDTKKALQLANRALEIADSINDRESIARAYNVLGIVHSKIPDYVKALDYYKISLELYEDLQDKTGIATALTNIGNIYNEMNQLPEALGYYERSLKIHRKDKSLDLEARITGNIGTIYEGMGKLDVALEWYDRSRILYTELNDTARLITAYLNLGSVYCLMNELDKAEEYFFRCAELNKEKDRNFIETYIHIGKLYNLKGNHLDAVNYLTHAFNEAKKITNLELILESSESLYEAYDILQQTDSSMKYRIIFLQADSAIEKEEVGRELRILSAERAIDLAKQRSRLKNILFGFFILTFGIIFLLLYRNYRINQKANRLLAEMDEMKSRLFSNISHEFRTPLTLILGPLEEMMELEKEKKPSKKTVQMMQRNANRLLDLVNQMLDLSKVDAGSMKLELVEEDIVKAIRVSILSFASLAEKRKILFSHRLPGEKRVTWFDPDKLEKILNNLVSNAFKFTPEGGRVKIEARLEQQSGRSSQPARLLITVEDTGKGIPEDQLEKIFDRFHQVEEAKEFETMGTGIGLALTKELVEVMHGSISVESQVGKGTKFSVDLPLGKEHLKESEYVIREIGEKAEDRKMKEPGIAVEEEECDAGVLGDEESALGQPIVLTVEDHEEIRTHILEHLEDQFRVLEAANGKAGLEIAIESVPDLIITDLMMPEMDGIELCKRLKTDERTSHIPVIMLTAKASVEERLEGLETGADAYVTKPFHIKELRLRVSKLIEQRNKLRERFSREITLEPKDIAVTSTDERFLQKAMACVEEHMGDSDFDVGQFQQEMSMSRMQLFRKLKAMTNHTPSEFIRNLRLKRAARLIEKNFGNVAEVCYEVGFNNLSYFAKCFKELFGMLPSEYGKTKG